MQKDALLVMDMQISILSRLPGTEVILHNVASAIATARSKNIPVIYVVVGFRSGAPEISINNKGFSNAKKAFASTHPEEMVKIDPLLSPSEGEIIVTKRRVSAFTGSDLEVILRALEIEHIVLTGVATGGVVLSTLRQAADKDYKITVLSDCCADADEEVHRILISKVFPRQAEVITAGFWKSIL